MAHPILRSIEQEHEAVREEVDREYGHEVVEELKKRELGDLLTLAQKELLVDLLAKLRTGTATHQELAILRNMLRDNGMVTAPRSDQQEAEDRVRPPADLPEFEEPDYEP